MQQGASSFPFHPRQSLGARVKAIGVGFSRPRPPMATLSTSAWSALSDESGKGLAGLSALRLGHLRECRPGSLMRPRNDAVAASLNTQGYRPLNRFHLRLPSSRENLTQTGQGVTETRLGEFS